MNKILKFDELSKLKKKFINKKIILAHGTFDFFHHGHLEHLNKSKSLADILVVSITSDRYVKKGPNRPLYNQKKRAALISHLDFVDYVVIIDNPTGIEVIQKLKPDFYSKGIEYKNHGEDYTRAINLEIKALKKNKGKIVYTKENVMSSSNLINLIMGQKNEKLQIFRKKFKKKNKFLDYLKIFEKLKNKKILAIGDVILDQYINTTALAKSPKEELISVKERNKTIRIKYAEMSIFDITPPTKSRIMKRVTIVAKSKNFTYLVLRVYRIVRNKYKIINSKTSC